MEEAAATATRAGVGILILTHYVPGIEPGQEDDWCALAASEFDQQIELGDDLHRVEVHPGVCAKPAELIRPPGHEIKISDRSWALTLIHTKQDRSAMGIKWFWRSSTGEAPAAPDNLAVAAADADRGGSLYDLASGLEADPRSGGAARGIRRVVGRTSAHVASARRRAAVVA